MASNDECGKRVPHGLRQPPRQRWRVCDAYSRPALQSNSARHDRGGEEVAARHSHAASHARAECCAIAVRSDCLLLDSFAFLVCGCCHSWPPVTFCRQVDKWDYLNQSSVSNLCVRFASSRRFVRCRSFALLSNACVGATAAGRVSFSEKFERWRAVKQVFHLVSTGHVSCVRVIATRWYSNAAVCGRCGRQNAPFSVHCEFSMPFIRCSHSFSGERTRWCTASWKTP